jgi:hypothetical protein
MLRSAIVPLLIGVRSGFSTWIRAMVARWSRQAWVRKWRSRGFGNSARSRSFRRICGQIAGRGSAPDRIRTCDLRFRRPTLYPTELRARDPGDAPRGNDCMESRPSTTRASPRASATWSRGARWPARGRPGLPTERARRPARGAAQPLPGGSSYPKTLIGNVLPKRTLSGSTSGRSSSLYRANSSPLSCASTADSSTHVS